MTTAKDESATRRLGRRQGLRALWAVIAAGVALLGAVVAVHDLAPHPASGAPAGLERVSLWIGAALLIIALALYRLMRAQHSSLRASELRFNRFFERSDPAILADMNTRCVIDANEGAEALFALSRQALIGQPVTELLSESEAVLADLFTRVDAEGSAWSERIRCRVSGGGTVHTEVSGTLKPEEDNLALLRFRNVDEHRRVQQALYSLAQSSSVAEEQDFVRNCVRELAQNFRARWALAGTFADASQSTIRTLAVWDTNAFVENFTYDLEGTPCAEATDAGTLVITEGAMRDYPGDAHLNDLGVESYIGAALRDLDHNKIGIVVVMDDRPQHRSALLQSLIGIYANRLSQELLRRNALRDLRHREENYRDLVDGSVQGTIIHRDWQPLYANVQALRMFGYDSLQELRELPSLRELFAPYELEKLERFRRARMQGEAVPGEYEIDAVRRDGTPIVAQNLVRLINWEGEPAIQSTYLDVTRRHRTEQALRESEANFRRLTDDSLEGILIHRDFKPLYVNPAFARMFGYPADEMLACDSIELLFATNAWPQVRDIGIARARGEHAPKTYVIEMCHRDGRLLEVQISATRTQWNGRDAVQATMIDVTEQRQGERILTTLHEFSTQQSLGFAERMQALLRTGCRYFGLPCGVLARVRDGACEVLSAVAPDGSLRDGDVLCATDTYCGDAVARDQPLMFADAHAAWPDDHPARRQSLWRSIAIIPLRVRGEAYGALAFADAAARERPFTSGDQRVLDLMGRWVASELARREDERDRVESEQRFRDFAESSADWFWETDREMRFRFFHGKNREAMGLSATQIVGLTEKQVYGRFVENPDQGMVEYQQRLRAQKSFQDLLLHWRRPDGQLRILSNSGQPVFDPHGNFLGYRGAGRDVTDQILAQDALRQSEQRFRDYASVAADWFWETDADLRLTFVSERHAELTNWPVEHFLGRTPQEAYADHEPSHSKQLHEQLQNMRQRRPYAVRIETKRTDGSPMIIFNQGIPIFGDDGEFCGYRGIGRDITDRVTTERELEKHRHSLEELVRERTHRLEQAQKDLLQQERLATIGRLVATVSHELRNPLGAVRNAAYYLQRKIPEAETRSRQQLGIIAKEINAADKIISDLLETTRAKVPVIQELELPRLVTQVLDACAAGEGVEFRTSFTPTDMRVIADQGHLRQILLNLVTNAVQAVRNSGCITVSAEHDGETSLIHVRDDGPGVPPEHREQIFEPLFTTRSKGNGLGLWLSRELAERHGGTLQLQSATRAGAGFTIALPRRQSAGDLAAAS